MTWNGQNRTVTGAGLQPLSRIVGMAVYGFDGAVRPGEREARRLRRALKHRRLICLRRQPASVDGTRRLAADLCGAELGGVLAAPANLRLGDGIGFADRDLQSRLGDVRPEFAYRHRWQAGDVLIWTRRLALIG